MCDYIYLDYNATTPICKASREAMLPFLNEHFGNPSSNHFYGEAPRKALRNARQQVGNLLNAENWEEDIVFTSGGTESNNIAVCGLILPLLKEGRKVHIVTTSVEHPAIFEPCNWLHDQYGVEVTYVQCDANGVVSVEDVVGACTQHTALVTVMHANNEVGSIQPVSEICAAVRKFNKDIMIHSDASQSIGKVVVDVQALGLDMLTVCGHKLYAPKGTGALCLNARARGCVKPFTRGAMQERGIRAGTEPVAQCVALGAACAQFGTNADIVKHATELAELRDLLFTSLCDMCHDNVELAAGKEARRNAHTAQYGVLPNTLSFVFPGDIRGECIVRDCPTVCMSLGSACHSSVLQGTPTNTEDAKKLISSVTLRAMGTSYDTAASTVRLSLGTPTTHDEVLSAAQRMSTTWKSIREQFRKLEQK